MTLHDAQFDYLAVVDPGRTGHSIKGADRDAGLLPLSCVPLLAMCNHGYSYPVFIDRSSGRAVLHLVGAPSGWRLGDLYTHGYPQGLALDFGQNWICTNIDAVLAMILDLGLYGVAE